MNDNLNNSNPDQDLVVAQARRLSSGQCDSGQVEISIESELWRHLNMPSKVWSVDLLTFPFTAHINHQ